MGNRENKFQSLERLCQLTDKFSADLISTFKFSYELQNLFSTFDVVRNDFFENLFKTVAQKLAIQVNVNNLGKVFFRLLLELVVDSF